VIAKHPSTDTSSAGHRNLSFAISTGRVLSGISWALPCDSWMAKTQVPSNCIPTMQGIAATPRGPALRRSAA
jgi:hypothetical protein